MNRTALIADQVATALDRVGMTYTPSADIDAAIEALITRKKDTPRTNRNISGEVASRIIVGDLS